MFWAFIFLVVLVLAISIGFTTAAQKPPCLTNRDEFVDDEEILDIDDPRVAEAVRVHAARFRDPVRHVAICGNDIVLLAENGDVVDICALV